VEAMETRASERSMGTDAACTRLDTGACDRQIALRDCFLWDQAGQVTDGGGVQSDSYR